MSTDICAFTNPPPHINITGTRLGTIKLLLTLLVTLLLQFGADVNKIDEQKFTPLVYAVWNSQKVTFVKFYLNAKIWQDLTKLLLDNGANPHSALPYAKEKGDMEMLQQYLTNNILFEFQVTFWLCSVILLVPLLFNLSRNKLVRILRRGPAFWANWLQRFLSWNLLALGIL